MISLVERGGVRTFVIIDRTKHPAMASWPVPSIALIHGTTVGAEFIPRGSMPRVTAREDGSLAPISRDQWIELRQEEQFDAVLYLGDAERAAPMADRLRSLCRTP